MRARGGLWGGIALQEIPYSVPDPLDNMLLNTCENVFQVFILCPQSNDLLMQLSLTICCLWVLVHFYV